MSNKILSGNTSPETAFMVEDYPYGFLLRTRIRYWVETSDRYGQRFVSQTMNPKNGEWNKPKASTYTSFVVLFVDESNGHLHWAGWHPYNGAEALQKFVDEYGAGLDVVSTARAKALLALFAAREARRSGT